MPASTTDSPKTASEDSSSSRASPRKTSVVNLTLLYLTLIGLGAIVGFLAFYSVFNHRCADLLDESERRHNNTRQELQERYVKAIEDHHICLDDESKELELLELRSRLKGQIDLDVKHRLLLEKHQQTMEKLLSLQSLQEENRSEIKHLQGSVAEKESELAKTKKEAEVFQFQKEELMRKLQKQKEFKEALHQQKDENANLLRENEKCQADLERVAAGNEEL